MIGQPRTKSDVELEWSAQKRAITARVNFESQVWRERELNARLDEAWRAFKKSLENDVLPSGADLELPDA